MRHRAPNYVVWCSLLVSLALHLVVIYHVALSWREAEEAKAFRARIANIPKRRFEPLRMRAPEPRRLPPSEMEYLAAAAEPERMTESIERPTVDLPALKAPEVESKLREIGAGARPETLSLAEERKLSPHEYGWADTAGRGDPLDLMRMQDLARAGRDPATVIPDLHTRRDTRGFLNLSRLQLYGAGTRGKSIDALARYAGDHTHVLVDVVDVANFRFDSEDLLDDPVHFLFQDAGRLAYDSSRLTHFDEEEKELLGRYMTGGGLLYLEGGYRYLSEMAAVLQEILGAKGSVGPVTVDHGLYHSFFAFPGGFPGEEAKEDQIELPGQTWYYPGSERADEVDVSEELILTPVANEEISPTMPTLGLWGVFVEGRLAAVLSDISLHENWAASFEEEQEEATTAAGPYLQAGTNILMYVLTREGGLAPVRAKPAWEVTRPKIPVAAESGFEIAQRVAADTDGLDLFADLDGSLALLLAPFGDEIERGLEIRLGNGYSVSLLKGGGHGILFQNLPAGRHWVQVEYGGESRELEVTVQGGKVTTLTFGLSRLAFLTRLRLNEQPERITAPEWFYGFADLKVQEMFLAEDRELLQR